MRNLLLCCWILLFKSLGYILSCLCFDNKTIKSKCLWIKGKIVQFSLQFKTEKNVISIKDKVKLQTEIASYLFKYALAFNGIKQHKYFAFNLMVKEKHRRNTTCKSNKAVYVFLFLQYKYI